jgi:uncharacterized protein (TIGR02145 family)
VVVSDFYEPFILEQIITAVLAKLKNCVMKKILSKLAVVIFIASCNKNSTPAPAPVPTPPLTDIDGNVYSTVKIGTQIWMQQNLNTSRYRNGDLIPKVTDSAAWVTLTTGAYCYYNNDSATYAATYGKLYNWYAVNDSRGLAPAGWHVPSDAEWTTLVTYAISIKPSGDVGGKLKAPGTAYWASPNSFATNSSGFTGLPAGQRYDDNVFFGIHTHAYFLSSSENNTNEAWGRVLFFSPIGGFGTYGLSSPIKRNGLSVRCIKD